ncbi:MAG: substrate-binding domain-containing protein [Oligoflexus sp.]
MNTPDKIKIGFLLSTMKEERYQHDRSLFMQEAQQHNLDVIFASSNNDAQLQFERSKQMIDLGVKLLVLQPVDIKESKKIVEYYYEHDIPVIAYDRSVESEALLAHVTHSNFQIGVLQAKEAIEKKKDIRNVIICAGEKEHNVAMEITKANIEVLEAHGIEPIVIFHPKWSSNQCKASVLKQIKEGLAVDVVLANNSQMAQGAIEALESLGIDATEIFIAGADGTTQACQNILVNKQDFDVQKPIGPLVKETLKLAQHTLNFKDLDWKRKIKYTKTVSVPVSSLRKNNLESAYQILTKGSQSVCKKPSW